MAVRRQHGAVTPSQAFRSGSAASLHGLVATSMPSGVLTTGEMLWRGYTTALDFVRCAKYRFGLTVLGVRYTSAKVYSTPAAFSRCICSRRCLNAFERIYQLIPFFGSAPA